MNLSEHQEQQRNRQKAVTMFSEEVVRLTEQLKQNLQGVSNEAGRAVAENLEWREWAKTILFGERYWENEGCNIGMPSDLRSCIGYRFREMEQIHAKRISQLESELVAAQLALSQTKK